MFQPLPIVAAFLLRRWPAASHAGRRHIDPHRAAGGLARRARLRHRPRAAKAETWARAVIIGRREVLEFAVCRVSPPSPWPAGAAGSATPHCPLYG